MQVAQKSQVGFSELKAALEQDKNNGVRIDDPEILEDVRSLLQEQTGQIKRITWLETKGIDTLRSKDAEILEESRI